MQRRGIVLAVTGGIAAYKAADLCSKSVQAGLEVTVVMSPAARKFVGPATFAALSNRPVVTRIFSSEEYPRGAHIELAERAELLVVAPATAHFLAQAAHGFADDLVATLMLSYAGPKLVCPAMNTDMWENPAVQRNVATLRNDGVEIVEPGSGWLSCGRTGAGRMAEPQEILKRIQDRFVSVV